MKRTILAAGISLLALSATAQISNYDVVKLPHYKLKDTRKLIRIPHIMGYQTLKVELHAHTIYSDGQVLPRTRIDEAWQDGLDAIAITDHMGSRNFKDTDDNTSYEQAIGRANQIGMLLIRSTELTYSEPTGHINAFFIKDANEIYKSRKGGREVDPANADATVLAAYNQGAFLSINHPGWPDNESTLTDQQLGWIKKGYVKGIELFNEGELYPKSVDDCLKYNLAMTAATDIHGLTAHLYAKDAIRPMTLVLAKERTLESIQEAMTERRTLALYNGQLAGKREFVEAIYQASIVRQKVAEGKEGRVTYELTNTSDIPFVLESAKQEVILLNPATTIRYETGKNGEARVFKVKNIWLSSKDNLEVTL